MADLPRTLGESAAGWKFAPIRVDLLQNRGGLGSAHLIASRSDSKLTVSMSMTNNNDDSSMGPLVSEDFECITI